MDGGAWWAAVQGVAKSQTRLSNFTFTFHFHTLEKEMATHSSVLAWRIPGMVEPGGLLSMGSHRVCLNPPPGSNDFPGISQLEFFFFFLGEILYSLFSPASCIALGTLFKSFLSLFPHL